MCEKYIKMVVIDGEVFNQVAVIHSSEYGLGWFTLHSIVDALYDPNIVKMILNEAPMSEIGKYCLKHYPTINYLPKGFDIKWVNQGDEFVVREYDGLETVQLKQDIPFLTA